MDGDTLVELILAIAIVGIPAAALSLRFVLRPMLKDVTEAIRSIRQPTSPQLEQRLAELEEGQQLIGEQLKRLVEAERFRAQLHSGSESK
jgi:hypothetical protein